MTTDKIQRR